MVKANHTVLKPEETIDFHIRWAWAKISKAYNAEALKSGGSMAIGYVLLNIDKEGTPSTKLGPKMGMEPTSLTRLLKSMEDMELITRQNDKVDKRVVRVFLTPKGKSMREVSKNVVVRFNKFIQENIGKQKLDVFLEVIQQLNTLLEQNLVFEPEITTTNEKNN